MDASLLRYNTSSRVLRSTLQNSCIIEVKLTRTFYLIRSKKKDTLSKNQISDTILKSEQYFKESSLKNSIIHCSWLGFEILSCEWLWVIVNDSLEWKFALYIGFGGNLSVVTGVTLPNRHICSVGMGATIPSDTSPNRHIHSIGTGATVLNRYIRSYTTFNMGLKNFHFFDPIFLLY